VRFKILHEASYSLTLEYRVEVSYSDEKAAVAWLASQRPKATELLAFPTREAAIRYVDCLENPPAVTVWELATPAYPYGVMTD
jgi:hypothetical protein